MPRYTFITISDHFDSFIGGQIKAGRYGSVSEVVRAGLRLLEEHEIRAKALESSLIAGEQSGKPRPFDFDAFKERKRAEQSLRL